MPAPQRYYDSEYDERERGGGPGYAADGNVSDPALTNSQYHYDSAGGYDPYCACHVCCARSRADF